MSAQQKILEILRKPQMFKHRCTSLSLSGKNPSIFYNYQRIFHSCNKILLLYYVSKYFYSNACNLFLLLQPLTISCTFYSTSNLLFNDYSVFFIYDFQVRTKQSVCFENANRIFDPIFPPRNSFKRFQHIQHFQVAQFDQNTKTRQYSTR